MEMINDCIGRFVNKIVEFQSGTDYTNIFHEYPSCRKNLLAYLTYMWKTKPAAILVGEAPGHKGCARTGIAFTDEAHLLWMEQKGILSRAYLIDEKDRDKPEKEQSAGIIWGKLTEQKNLKVLLWNIYPFHPHQANNQNSNRTPRQEELALGKLIFQELITIFPATEVFAIGRVAQKTLGLEEGNYIRHPAHGGANRCRKDLEDKVFSSL